MNYDVLIIGAGMAGLMAAIQAGEKGKKVCLVAKGQGAVNLTSGTIDILGSLSEEEIVITDNLPTHLANLIQAVPEHPYAKAGLSLIQDGIKEFIKITEGMAYPYYGDGQSNYLLPTAFGTIRPTALVPQTMVHGDIRIPGDVLVIGFEELLDFPSKLITDRINIARERMGLEGRWESFRIPLGIDSQNLIFIGKWLEQEENFQQLTKKIRKRIATYLPKMSSNYRIALPAIIGADYDLQLFNKLQASLGCSIFEIPFGQPTIPGIRLNKLLLDYAKGKGIEVRLGTEVLSGCLGGQGGEIIINSAARPITLRGKQIVLATGGSFGKGIIVNAQEFKESIFDLPIKVNPEIQRLAGIMVNSKFQPVLMRKQNDIELGWKQNLSKEAINSLNIVGRSLAGYDQVKEKSGLGVAMVTGFAVGKLIGGDN